MNSVPSAIPGNLRAFARVLLTGLLALLIAVAPIRSEAAAAPPNGGQTQEAGVAIDKVEVGFQGWYKVGEWTRLAATLRATDNRTVTIVVDAPDPDDNVASLPGKTIGLKAGDSARVETCFRTGRLSGDVVVRIQDRDGRTLAQKRLRAGSDQASELRPALRLDVPLWVIVGKADLVEIPPLSDLPGTSPAAPTTDADRDLHIVRLDSPADLPQDSRAFQSVEMLILPTGRGAGGGISLLDQISPENDATLRDWVQMGGHLLVSVGAEAEEFRNSSLAKWIPIAVEGQMLLRQLSGFESFAAHNAPLRVSGTVKAARLERLPQANMIIRETGSPLALVAGRPFGFGHVTLVGVDLDAAPLSNWKALRPVLQKLAGDKGRAARNVSQRTNRQLTHVGVTDLATQFQQTHEDFAAVHRPSYWWVMGLILIYVAVIGPLDYLLVHRLLRRPELTWLTLLVLVGAGAALAAWKAADANDRGVLVNQFDLVDIDAGAPAGAVRGRTWVSLYSPRHERFSAAVEPSVGVAGTASLNSDSGRPGHVTWSGIPENAVGGLYRAGNAGFTGCGYLFSPFGAGIENLPVAQWSIKTICAEWETSPKKSMIDCTLENFGVGQLKGSITHHLDTPLEDCLLVVGGWAYLPKTADATLKPGFAWRPSGDEVRQRDLKALLTGAKTVRRNKEDAFNAEIVTTTESYDPLSRNRNQQVAMLSFHEAAGGTEYTGLADAALRDLELTGLMQLGRGILIGRLPSAAAQVTVNGSPARPTTHSAWVRIVIPVLQSDRAPDKVIPKASPAP